jgi:uncharacterized surface protein with fasciclin (FAS1) repeats
MVPVLLHDPGDPQAKTRRRQGDAEDGQRRELTAAMRGHNVVVTDAKGNMAVVTTADMYQSNGVIHVVGNVLLPG